MWKDMTRVACAASMWAMAIVAMVVASTSQERLVLAGWGILLAIGGTFFMLWHLATVERHRVETIARLLDRQRDPEGLRRV